MDKNIILKDIKNLDPWILIETYFRDNPNYKTQHQIDSFNEFTTCGGGVNLNWLLSSKSLY